MERMVGGRGVLWYVSQVVSAVQDVTNETSRLPREQTTQSVYQRVGLHLSYAVAGILTSYVH